MMGGIMNNDKMKTQKTPICKTSGWKHVDWRERAPKGDGEFNRWMAKYLPFEREIIAERERREERRQKRLEKRRYERRRAYGDFCEATEGRAAFWRESGFQNFEAVFEIATDAFTEKTAERYFRLAGINAPKMPRFSEIVAELILLHFILTLNVGAVISCCALRLFVQLSALAVNHLKHRTTRPLYYEREAQRRHSLAADRRRIVKRATTNPCPTKEAILEAYQHRKDSKEAAIRFGSLIHDLECYVDNSLKIVEGRITGRNEGVKGWLAENIPVLVSKYTTVMRYKAMAKKLKQLVELPDPIPAETVLVGTVSSGTDIEGNESDGDQQKVADDVPNAQIVRAVAIYREISAEVKSATGIILKIDSYLDPARIEEATTLAVWRERYRNEITVRNKKKWWRRLVICPLTGVARCAPAYSIARALKAVSSVS